MKINFLKLIVICLFVVFGVQVNAQSQMIRGIVTTFDSIAVIGAEIIVKSTKEIIKSDTLGQFTVKVNPGDQLKVQAKGFSSEKVKLEDNTKLVAVNLKLKPGEKSKEYAIGYGYVKDAEKLNAVAQLSNKDMDFSQYSDIYDLIRGRFAGVQVQSNGDIIIRGVNSITLSSAALIVVDGMTVDQSLLSSISPTNVKSINILKDGSSAIYGARGANGVVIIETKRGDDE
ncbi:TonB-dependent receptor plug domain-containing protein [uncultured Draconibacterium sp.]|uniref:TonB-dependent receptor plug domain-containing protein n=1 Tax=uncultured Draconibacterium sp. TaxID=1573823 RepID=UPI00321702F2